ncbi:MAG: gliding motility-associated transport system permease protein [Candidatus Cloacimonadota bacterium]|nr:gliding motility-associated transport system permease protein [Candidatus Cloacimonadota bacterium]
MKSYFNSPAAYIVLVVFLLIAGWFFASPLFINNQAELRTLFNIVPMIFIFFVPAITMGLIAKERNIGTIEQLSTFPIKESQIVMGKFWASLGLIAVGLLFTLVHFLTIIILGQNIDYGAIICGYLGLILLGAVYSSIGIFASSLTDNQIVAFIISFLIIFFLFILEYSLFILPSYLSGFFQYLSIGYHFSNLTRGVIDTRNLVYFGSLIVLFLRFSVLTLENRKWK